MNRILLLLIALLTVFGATAQKTVHSFNTPNGTQILNSVDIRMVYETFSGCLFSTGPVKKITVCDDDFGDVTDSLGTLFGTLTERYFVGAVLTPRQVAINKRAVTNVRLRNSYVIVTVREPEQSVTVQEDMATTLAVLGVVIGDGAGSGGSVGHVIAADDVAVSQQDTLNFVSTDAVTATVNNTGASSDVTIDLAQNGATSGQVLKWDGSAWTPDDDNTTAGAGGHVLANAGTPVTQRDTADFLDTGDIDFTVASDATKTTVVGDINAGAVGATEMASTAVTPGTYGSATESTQFTVDADGRLTAASNVTISGVAPADGDKGDIDVTSSGVTWTIDTSSVTTLKILDGTVANVDLNSGVGGIYKGSGTVPNPTTATVTDNLIFNYGNNDNAISVNGGSGLYLYSNNASQDAIQLENNSIQMYTEGNASVALQDTNVTIFVPGLLQLAIDADYGSAGQVLTAQGDGTSKWQDGGIPDGDKGDIDVTASGATWTIDTSAVTSLKILDGTVTNADLSSGVGGIYKGSGTIAPAAIATISSGSTFGIDWSDANNLISANDATGGLEMDSKDGNSFMLLEGNGSILGSAYGELDLTILGLNLYDYRVTKKGLEYGADYSADYTLRSLVDKGYVTGVFPGSTNITTLGTITTGTWNGTDIAYANIAQGSARSVLGVAGNATADVASIQGTADQVLRVNTAGTALAFGTIENAGLSSGVGGIYKGSGTVASGTVSTLADTWNVYLPTSGYMSLNYDGGAPALQIDDDIPLVSINSKDGDQVVEANNTNITFNSGASKMVYRDSVLEMFDGDAGNFIRISPPARGNLTSNYTIILPVNDGNPGEVLTTDGSGTTSWAADATGVNIYTSDGDITQYVDRVVTLHTGTTLQIQDTIAGVIANFTPGSVSLVDGVFNAGVDNVGITTTGVNVDYDANMTITLTGNATTNIGSGKTYWINYANGNQMVELTAGGIALYSPAVSENEVMLLNNHIFDVQLDSLGSFKSHLGTIYLGYDGGNVRIGGGAAASELRFYEASGSGTNYFAIKAQAMASNFTFTWPADDGTSGQVLQTDGSGTLTWATSSGGNGIYGGSGTIATAAVATVGSTSSFTIDYDGGNDAIKVDDNISQTIFKSKDGNGYFRADNTGILLGYSDTAGGELSFSDTDIKIYDYRVGAAQNGIEYDSEPTGYTDLSIVSRGYVLNTFPGSTNITTLGTIATGTWNGTDIAYANIAQGSARSVLGVTGNATADVASIQGTADQVLRVNTAGTALAFGTIENAGLSSGVGGPYKGSGTIPSGTASTVANNTTATYAITYFGGNGAFAVDESTNSTYMGSEDGSNYVYVTNNDLTINMPAAPGADLKASGTTITLTANENQAFGDVCYIQSDGDAALADADGIATAKVTVMCMETVTTGNSAQYLLVGVARNDAWAWTVGGHIYLSTTGTTGNTLTQTAPSGTDDCVVVVGIATHADRMIFNPSPVIIELN
jgi:hypothetical protein